MKRLYLIFIMSILVITAFIPLSSCGGAASANVSNDGTSIYMIDGSASNLTFTTPYLIPSTSSSQATGYVQVSNLTNVAINSVTYSINGVIGDPVLGVTLANNGSNCSDIESGASCFLIVNVESGSNSSSVMVSSSNALSNLDINKKLLGQMSIKANGYSTSKNNFNVVGIQSTDFADVVGADGINLYYYTRVLKDTPYVIISGVVTSQAVGKFNNVVLIDSRGNALESQSILSGNLGVGAPDLVQGSTFTLQLAVPSGINSEDFKLQIEEESTTGATNIQTGIASYNLMTVRQQAIVSVTPARITLSSTLNNNVLSLANIGDVTATNLQVTSLSDNLEVTPLPMDTLESSSSTTFTVSIKDLSQIVNGNNVLVVNYNNGESDISFGINVNITGANQPGPTPLPGLNLTFSPDNNFYTTSEVGTSSRTVTITNQGNSNETNFEFTLPDNFTLAPSGTSQDCDIGDSNQITSVLVPNESCTVLVTYANFIPTTQSMGVITVNYNYGSTGSASAQVAVNYMVTAVRFWSRQVGALYGFTNGYGISIDSNSNSYVAGATSVGLSGESQNGTADYFIAKYSESGSLLWSKQVGVLYGETWGQGVATDVSGNSYVVGLTKVGLSGESQNGLTDYFIAKYNTNGLLQWSRQVGVSGSYAYANGVSTDLNGNAYVTGYTYHGLSGQTQNGIIDYFIAKYDGNGSLLWSRQVGVSGGNTYGNGVSVDSTSNAYVAGTTSVGISGQTQNGLTDYFIAKYDGNGSLLWSRQVGASGGNTYGNGISVDSNGLSYITGSTSVGISGQTQNGLVDYIIAKYNSSGSLLWTKQVGASGGNTYGNGVSVDPNGIIYATGDTSVGLSGQLQNGDKDYFIVKYSSSGSLIWAQQVGVGGYLSIGYGIIADSNDNAYVAGSTTVGLFGQSQNGGVFDYFIARYLP